MPIFIPPLTLKAEATKIYIMLKLLLVIALQFAITIFFIYFVIHNDRGQKEPSSGIWSAIGFGFFALILTTLITFIMKNLPGLQDVSSLNNTTTGGTVDISYLFLAAMLVGVIEETVKALPLALYIYKKPYFNELTDGIFYFGISGIIFGLTETIMYTLLLGSEVGIMRVIITPFLHVGFSMWFGYTLARYKLQIGGVFQVMMAFVGSMFLHGLYNFGLSMNNPPLILGSILLAISLNIGVFLLYRHAQKIDTKLIAVGLEDKPNSASKS